MKSSRDVVMAAVQQSGDALQYAGEELKDNWEIVYTAMQAPSVGNPVEYASEEIKKRWDAHVRELLD